MSAKLLAAALLLANSLTAASISRTDIYVAGEGGYHSYRIPALIVSAKGTLLAFCEGRRNGRRGHGRYRCGAAPQP
jgi:sialidase-1